MNHHKTNPQKNNAWKSQRRHQQKQQPRKPLTALEQATLKHRRIRRELEARQLQVETQKKQQKLEQKQRDIERIDVLWAKHLERMQAKQAAWAKKKRLTILLYKARNMHLLVPMNMRGVEAPDDMTTDRLSMADIETAINILEVKISKVKARQEEEKELLAAQWRQRQIEKVRAYRAACLDIVAAPGDTVPVVTMQHVKTGIWPIASYPVRLETLINEFVSMFLNALRSRAVPEERVFHRDPTEIVVMTKKGVYVHRTDQIQPMPVVGDIARVERIKKKVWREKPAPRESRVARNRVRKLIDPNMPGVAPVLPPEQRVEIIQERLRSIQSKPATPMFLPIPKPVPVSLIDQPKKDVIREAWEI